MVLAGDTDTNTCICAGLVGAYYGLSALPQDKVSKVLKTNYFEGTKANRPDHFKPSLSYQSRFDLLFEKCSDRVVFD